MLEILRSFVESIHTRSPVYRFNVFKFIHPYVIKYTIHMYIE